MCACFFFGKQNIVLCPIQLHSIRVYTLSSNIELAIIIVDRNADNRCKFVFYVWRSKLTQEKITKFFSGYFYYPKKNEKNIFIFFPFNFSFTHWTNRIVLMAIKILEKFPFRIQFGKNLDVFYCNWSLCYILFIYFFSLIKRWWERRGTSCPFDFEMYLGNGFWTLTFKSSKYEILFIIQK